MYYDDNTRELLLTFDIYAKPKNLIYNTILLKNKQNSKQIETPPLETLSN